jgi:putative glycerol-1-phosphate prenyltransferase
MKNNILTFIKTSKKQGAKLVALLLDPDKIVSKNIPRISKKINENKIDFIFVGGSTVAPFETERFISALKKNTSKPIIIFPGDSNQITDTADGILFLSLLSGDNPEYLIHQQVRAAPILKKTNLEIIPTGYILIDGDNETAVQKVSQTKPIAQGDISKITATALAGMYMGKQLIYLEAGSGAKTAVNTKIILEIAKAISIPIIVGGGIRSTKGIQNAFDAGADIVVIGTAFEENTNFFQTF